MPSRGDRRGALWACVARVGLVRFDPLRPSFRSVPTLAALATECRAVVGDGTVWAAAGRPSRLYRLGATGAGRLQPVAASGAVERLVTDRRGDVWGVSAAGLLRLGGRSAVRVAGGMWSGGVADVKGAAWATLAEGAERWLCRLETSGPVRAWA